MTQYKHTIKCKECGVTLRNLADLGDYDEGFECCGCGIAYDYLGKEI